MTTGSSRFDRVRPRTAARDSTTAPVAPSGQSIDVEGKRALYSRGVPAPAPGGIVVTCSSCAERSVLTARGALRAAVPSVHLPVLLLAGVKHTSWMRCPACTRRTWVRLALRD